MKKILLALVAVTALAIAAGVAAFAATFPNVGPAREHKVASTPEVVERGRYLASHVTVCVDCHSTRDWTRFSGPPVEGTLGKGGERFGPELGFPGEFYAANITPAGVARYSDGELERVITTGVTKEGRAIFPVMPYPRYADLCQADVDALIAYVRSLAPIENTPPQAVLDFPMSVIVKTIPAEKPRPPCPDKSDAVRYGAYLANAAACAECHTQFEKGKFVEGMDYAGGRAFPTPSGTIFSANITPDPDTGIGGYTAESFIARIRAHGTNAEESAPVPPGAFQSFMPWTMYAGMTDDDLRAIFAYLRTVPAKKNRVVKWTPIKT
jgi:mono/diheme cytochrome c family protein